jgi:hypothetical protein
MYTKINSKVKRVDHSLHNELIIEIKKQQSGEENAKVFNFF